MLARRFGPLIGVSTYRGLEGLYTEARSLKNWFHWNFLMYKKFYGPSLQRGSE